MNLLFSVFSCIVFLGLVFGFDIGRLLQADGLNSMLLYFIPGNFLLTITSYYEWRMQLAGRFDRILYINIIRQSINLLLLVAGIFWWHRVAPQSLVWYFNGGLAAAALLALFTEMRLFKLHWRWPAAEIKSLFQYGRFALLTNTASSVFRTTDHFMVSALVSTAAVAPLSLCVRLINIIDIPSQVLSEVLFVHTAQRAADGGRNKAAETFEFAVGSALALVLPAVMVLCFFPSFFLLVIGGAKYTAYGWLLQLVCATALVMPFMRQFGTITDAAGMPALNALVMGLLMLLNIGACYIGVSIFGLAGAPLAVFSAQAIILVVILAIAKRHFNVSYARIWRSFIGCYSLIWQLLIINPFSRFKRKNNLT